MTEPTPEQVEAMLKNVVGNFKLEILELIRDMVADSCAQVAEDFAGRAKQAGVNPGAVVAYDIGSIVSRGISIAIMKKLMAYPAEKLGTLDVGE